MLTRRLHDQLLPSFSRFAGTFLPELRSGGLPQCRTVEELVPHAGLRLAMECDPALEALLPGSPGSFALGDKTCAPFRVRRSGVMLLPPVLLNHPPALAVTARWSMEALHALRQGAADSRRMAAVLRHAAGLMADADAATLAVLHAILPGEMAAELLTGNSARPSTRLLRWQAGLIEGANPDEMEEVQAESLELEMPLEWLLKAGGDGRLVVNPATGLNRYGVCPRPRPEAVHFSSSTASAISDYGFLFCDLLRRGLLDACLSGKQGLRQAAADATGRELCALTGLNEQEADVAIMASGTDAELLTVLLSMAGAKGGEVTNVLIAPEESGKGLVLAGAGEYFDDVSATGAPVKKGVPVVTDRKVTLRQVAIRDDGCKVRPMAEVDADFLAEARQALAQGHHVLAHVLLGSKTGLIAPSDAAVAALTSEAPQRVDVAVDACQMRSDFLELGEFVRRGWMVQVSGSKFLTGPPFSGALIIPAAMRERAGEFREILRMAPGAGRADDWCAWWSAQLPAVPGTGSYGPILRWLPALLEARLYEAVPHQARDAYLESFRAALLPRFVHSEYFHPLDHEITGESTALLSRLSIIAFQVMGRKADGTLESLNDRQCTWIFEKLNQDITPLLPQLGPEQRAAAALPCHIGQPVILAGSRRKLAFLRLVLGARFFDIVGHAGGDMAVEAALESEIADALRVLDKVELMASHWQHLEPLASN